MKLEVCIDRFESAQAAFAGGADRLEVCGALDVGGITPSEGLLRQCLELSPIEVVAMIRPHAGEFRYRSSELETMRRDIERARQIGVHGVVFGVLQDDRRVDRSACQMLLDAARPLPVTFHRAFDLTRDPDEALDDLLELGVDRLLTSGQAATAMAGARLIRRLVERSRGRISIMPGAGISAHDVVELIRATGVQEVHASARDIERTAVPSSLDFVRPSRITRREKVAALVAALRQLEREEIRSPD